MSPEPTSARGSASDPAPSGPAAPTGAASATIRYVDRADMVETFADSVTGLIFDGQTLRIEFGVTRFDDMKSHAADRGGIDPGRRGQGGATPWHAAAQNTVRSRTLGIMLVYLRMILSENR
jgi:hypothetical protein